MPILVGFVPTPEGRAALRRAVQECQLRHARLVVVDAERPGDHRPTAEHCESEVKAACVELGVPEPDLEIRRFENPYEPADHLLQVADEVAAELIVIGLRRRTGVGKLILGGSAQRILLDASCPVMAVKSDRDARVPPLGQAEGSASGRMSLELPGESTRHPGTDTVADVTRAETTEPAAIVIR